ncbi:hypothetical protein [Helicobacter acinonychis]|uniref:hypothetical protein n=1 Tax=Helicobacter acinonychis TaxID=212 RepID=UPI000CF14FB4|nr:hypothetical protein [Helicobacter acinonychis]
MEHYNVHTTMQILQTKHQKLLIELAELEAELKIKRKSHFNALLSPSFLAEIEEIEYEETMSKERRAHFNLLLSPNLMAKVDAYLKEKDLPNRSLFMEKALEFYMSKNP